MNHIIGILFRPKSEWERIRDHSRSVLGHYLKYIIIIALLPPVAWYIGASQVGWSLGEREIRLTEASALQISVLFYLAILIGIGALGYMVHWMSETYEAHTSTLDKGLAVAAYTCTPLFVVSVIGLYPLLWLDILIGCAAAGYTVYLLYIGVPIVMEIPEERGFLFASAMVAVGLVMTAALLGATVILWQFGAMPVFTE
ncbi:MAG: Yip1 family protein [Gammaproteobacteria bacterium]|nr:Yip1 family protein [Gammaproteobacteria bacterium]